MRTSTGKVLGGFTENSWTARNDYAGYDSAFLFSLSANKRYPPSQNYYYTTYSHTSYGPTFGNGHDIYINSSMDIGYCNFPYAYTCNGRGPQSSSHACSQELCGVDASSSIGVGLDELEVWIYDDF